MPFELTPCGLDQSGIYTKTFFVPFAGHPQLTRMFDAMQAAVPSAYQLNPHLSLLYQRLDEATRHALCTRTDIAPATPYRFDALRVIEYETPIEDARPVKTWKTVFKTRLAFKS